MTYTIMCQLADQIAAAGPLISGMTGAQIAECKPARPVPLMVVARATPSAASEHLLELIGFPISEVLHHVLRLS
jgi:poly(3-hydroxybutyrate) depolymerase